MEMEPDIDNMTLNEYLEVGAEKLRQLGQEKVQNGCNADTSGDTQFLMPNVPDEMDEVIRPLIPQPIHTTSPNDDYVAPATKSILDEILEEFRDEIMNVTMDDEEAAKDPHIAGGLDHVNHVIRLLIEHGISRDYDAVTARSRMTLISENATLVHYFLCHQLECRDEDTHVLPLTYRMRDIDLHFGRKEFCLVTGLRQFRSVEIVFVGFIGMGGGTVRTIKGCRALVICNTSGILTPDHIEVGMPWWVHNIAYFDGSVSPIVIPPPINQYPHGARQEYVSAVEFNKHVAAQELENRILCAELEVNS
uniref:Uncharacterized protein n=1 Tax=Tanacetum cinerariifolium TaxID=118510 RepID=A0A6L2L7M6_TANCI|nr:hypothetical protein [Tanacetum cinerariifolium]